MNEKQLRAAIRMGKDIADGKVDLAALDNKSLELRGKKQKGVNTKTDDLATKTGKESTSMNGRQQRRSRAMKSRVEKTGITKKATRQSRTSEANP